MELIVIAADLSPPVAALNAPERRERLSAIAKLAGELEQECRAYTKGWPELTDQEPPFQMIGPLHALATWASREREHIVGDARVNNNRISVRYAVAALMDLFSEGFGITATKSEKGATARFIYALLTDATGSPPRTDLLRDILRR